MEWKIYEEWLDITLYRQMTNLIYKLSSNEEKYKIYMQLKENDMFLEKPKVDMETAYGLHYPGEVLERIGEHLPLTKQINLFQSTEAKLPFRILSALSSISESAIRPPCIS